MIKRLFAIAALLVLLPGDAIASHIDLQDGNDTKSKLDIRKVEAWGSARPGRTIYTFANFTNREIYDSGYVLVWFDTMWTRRFDYYVLVRSTGSHLNATLWRNFKTKDDRLVGSASARRPSQRSLATRVRLDQMTIGDGRRAYRWQVQTLKTGPRCRNVCFDRSPNKGAVRDPIPKSLR